jgi:YD repeat-containing protein
MKMRLLLTLLALAIVCFAVAESVTFNYDTAGRLTGVSRNATNLTTFTYDVSGNLTHSSVRLVTDTDNDGLADSFELAYFGNLSRNGLGDFDGDGFSDLAEYFAGTVPTNSTSLLRMERVVTNTVMQTTVSWLSVSGRTYRVQFKNTLNDLGWNDLPGDVMASNTSAFKTDITSQGESQRYYRVQVLP